jgi:hypothetical protein
VASDTPWAPWFVVQSDDKRRARLNVIRHLLDHIPYEVIPLEKVRLPKRQSPADYKEVKHSSAFVADRDWGNEDVR